MFDHCLGHIEQLFDNDEYEKAFNTTFVTEESSNSWQMFVIFGVVFTIIIFSIYCTCRYLKNKTDEEDSGRFSRRYGKRSTKDTDDHYQRVRNDGSRRDESSQDNTETPVKKYRVPRSTRQYSNSELNKN